MVVQARECKRLNLNVDAKWHVAAADSFINEVCMRYTYVVNCMGYLYARVPIACDARV